MTPIDAFHLPGLEERDVVRWEVREYDGGIGLRWPVLASGALERLIARLRRARAARLAAMPLRERVRLLDEAAARLASPADPARALAERALPAVTGYSPAMIRLGLERTVPTWRADALWMLLRSEFDDPEVLDEFRPHARTAALRCRAYGPELAFHVFAGNVPGVAVTSLVRSLLVRAATLGKTAAGEPLLAALFARALADAAPELGACLAVTYWPGGTAALEEVALEAADTVVVYGGDEAVVDVRRRLPGGTRLVTHGPRISFGLVGRAALRETEAERTAAGVARAAAIFDQQGCVSPHLVYVERGGEVAPERFAALVAGAMDRLGREVPRGAPGPAEVARIQQLRGAAEFRALAGQDVRLFASRGTEYTVIYDTDPTFAPSCLNRFIWIKPLDALEQASGYLEPCAPYLQTAAIAGAGDRRETLAGRLGALGVSRVTDFERMPWPPAMWHHDGAGPLRELIRWVDMEE